MIWILVGLAVALVVAIAVRIWTAASQALNVFFPK